jgi:PAS domain S-box-containing protein
VSAGATSPSPARHPILLAEDDEGTAELARRALTRAKRTVRMVRRVDRALEELANERFELAVVDFRLEDGDAWPILDAAYGASPRIPVILVTAKGDEKLASEALHRGASEYVIKSGTFWEQLPAMADSVARLARIENENALLASVVHYSEDAIVAGSLGGLVEIWNPSAEQMFGWRTEEVVGKPIEVLFPVERRPELTSALAALELGGSVSHHPAVLQRKDGSRFEVIESISPIFDGAGRPAGVALVVRDPRAGVGAAASRRSEALRDLEGHLDTVAARLAQTLERLSPDSAGRKELEEARDAVRRAVAAARRSSS